MNRSLGLMTATGVMSSGHACRLDLPTRERVLAALTARHNGNADTPR